MKKIYLIILFLISFLFISKVNASEYPAIIQRLDHCFISGYQLQTYNSDFIVFIYDLPDDTSNFSFILNSGDRLRAFTSNDISSCGSSSSSRNIIFSDNSPTLNNEYSFTSNDKYLYIYLSATSGSYGQITWNYLTDDPVVPDPSSSIPHITISNHDFYLFYDFNTIINFDILSDYDFTTFTDYQKLVVCLLFNLFYISFIFFILYILLKALNKLLSWVFS